MRPVKPGLGEPDRDPRAKTRQDLDLNTPREVLIAPRIMSLTTCVSPIAPRDRVSGISVHESRSPMSRIGQSSE